MKVQDDDTQQILQSNDQLTIDEALTQVGGQHRYQKMVFVLFCLQWMLTNWILSAPIYLLKAPYVDSVFIDQHHEECEDQDSFSNDRCHKLICTLNNFENVLHTDSAVLQFHPPLICDDEYYAKILEQQVYIGSLLGFFIFSYVADNYGRRTCLIISWFLASLGAILIGSAQNYYMIGIGLFLCGFGANPAITVHYSFINEHSQGKFREYQGIGIQIFFGLGEIFLAIIGYYFQSWRVLCLYWFSIPILLLNIPNCLIKESPKFMYQRNKEVTVAILNAIAKINKKTKVKMDQLQSNETLIQNGLVKSYHFTDLLRYKSTRTSLICGFMIFLCIQYIFYSINFGLNDLGLNFYVGALVVGIFDTLSYSICDFVIPYIPRKRALMAGFLGSALFCFIYGLFDNDCDDYCALKIIQLICLGMIRFLITSVWSFAYVYLSELFPTVVRSLALGLISAGGTLGSIASPFNQIISKGIGLPNQLILLGCFGVGGAIFSALPKETYQRSLDDEIDELNVQKSQILRDLVKTL